MILSLKTFSATLCLIRRQFDSCTMVWRDGFASLQSTLFFKKSAGFGEKFKQVYNNFVLVYLLKLFTSIHEDLTDFCLYTLALP